VTVIWRNFREELHDLCASGDEIEEGEMAGYVEYLWKKKNAYRVSAVIWSR
jgi:hypothetical protein